MDDFNLGRDPRARSSSSQFKLDEGFAEDSQQHGDQIQNSFVAWLNTQSDKAKADIAYEILRTLRSTDIASVVDRLNPLLHMDPIEKLPPEITSQIFSYLDASTLLIASLSSQTWRERILDPRLWQDLYRSEGWGIDLAEVRAFEEAHTQLIRSEPGRSRDNGPTSYPSKGQSVFKRRALSDWLQSSPRRVSADVANWREQHGAIEADTDGGDTGDAEMTDAPLGSPQRPNKRPSQNEGDDLEYARSNSFNMAPDINMTGAPDATDLILVDEDGTGKLNWPHVYKQRYKLEQNWLQGRFTNFQLPHPDYPHEAHTECVYTIQFHGKWLVSGSRDKTLRVWDLETRRLRGKPLVGHSQSVLCLQFDPTPGEDTIISGSSDSSIIVWKFSTGQKLQTIPSAHEESVLNLRFDHRYLVTCSKDKKIKLWNRKALLPTDPDYPTARPSANCKIPSHIIDVSDVGISLLEARIADGVYKALKPYSHLMTLEGHSAAVNAIQIEDDKIVSASGDRHIRIWSIKNGTCPRLIPGHNKGIACVQYDGRRVVSGSSDNTVRIYDPATSSEVAVLLGHTNLVRTVQAGFGDLPGSEDEYMNATRQAEVELYKKLHSGTSEDRQYARRLRNGEFGSSRSTFGSKLPPGGGGSKWARIVSGSYDESIIIWKKDDHGHWVVGRTLKQDESFQASIENDRTNHNGRGQRHRGRPHHDNRAQQQQPGNTSSNDATNFMNSHVSASQIVQATMNTSMTSLQTSIQNLVGVNQSINNLIPNIHKPLLNHLQDSASRTAQLRAQTQQLRSQMQQTPNHIPPGSNTTATTTTTTGGGAGSSSGSNNNSTTGASSSRAAPPPPSVQPQPQPRMITVFPHPQHPGVSYSGPGHENREPRQVPAPPSTNGVSRVFKLQFDARRIVCCSQDSRIIGWDFANGDGEIEECARFFVGP